MEVTQMVKSENQYNQKRGIKQGKSKFIRQSVIRQS